MPSGCEFCLELAGRVCFLAVTFIYWAGKEVGNVELGFGDCVCWKHGLCRVELCQERAPQRQRLSGCIQEPLSFLTLPSRPALSLH